MVLNRLPRRVGKLLERKIAQHVADHIAIIVRHSKRERRLAVRVEQRVRLEHNPVIALAHVPPHTQPIVDLERLGPTQRVRGGEGLATHTCRLRAAPLPGESRHLVLRDIRQPLAVVK